MTPSLSLSRVTSLGVMNDGVCEERKWWWKEQKFCGRGVVMSILWRAVLFPGDFPRNFVCLRGRVVLGGSGTLIKCDLKFCGHQFRPIFILKFLCTERN